ncbi:diguanylate cyclase [Motiliproteus sp.]|uniref:diguanylate cyclase n=1 Tax=Motiliproteus sp. TaxID=1898955 RepID=UPI003BAC3DF4
MANASKVLIVEDSVTMGRVLSYLVRQKLGFIPVVTTSLQQTRQYLEEGYDPDLVAAVVDLNLPDAPHGEAVDVVMDKGVPVIVLSGLVDPETRRSLLDKGVVDYLNKEGRYAYEYVIKLIRRLVHNPSIKTLVVDDSRVSRGLMVSLLRQYNIDPMEAANGAQALELLQQQPDIELLITDFNMERMDGFELTTRVRQQYSPEQLVIIGVSSVEDDGALSAKFIKSGANDFLQKPFSHEEFHCRIMQNLELMEMIQRLNRAASTDALTGLSNRRHFFEQGSKLLKQADAQQQPVSVAQLDLDHFKQINDRYGHEAGDGVLVAFSQLLEQHFSSWLCARMGGEEFALVLLGCDQPQAMQLLERFQSQVNAQAWSYQQHSLSVSCSIGLSTDAGDLDERLRLADQALYRAKAEGRNRICGSD